MDKHRVETTLYSLADSVPEPVQRRTSQRHLSLLRVGALMIGDQRELCLIRNISAGGMMIRTYSPVEVGARLSVELKHGEAVAGTAKWTEDGSIGIGFDEPIDVLSLIAPAQDGLQPRMPRIEVNCTVWLRDGSEVHRSKTLNISQGGLCCECARDVEVGAAVTVSLNGLAPLPGVVKWRDAELYGVGFNRVLPLSELMAWLQQQRPQQRRAAAG